MAIPTAPLEVWALDNYVLPMTGQLNKQRPIDDLWAKGYDKGQKPSCETWNYLFNLVTAWLKYITGEQIPDLDGKYLKIASNLSDVPDVATARTNLGVYSKTESDAKFVDVTGDTMTGPLTLPRLNFLASSSDFAYITTTTPSTDTTYFDFVVGDNIGAAGTAGIDSMRFIFTPSGASNFVMMELNATSVTTAMMRLQGDGLITGNLNVNQSFNAGSINTAGLTQTGALTVTGNGATVGGRNIVRSVNGATADANGNATIVIPDQGVQDVRLSAEGIVDKASFTAYSAGRRAMVPDGAYMTGLADYQTGKAYLEDTDAIWYRYLQKQIGGVWYNVSTL